MREVELKAVVVDEAALRAALRHATAELLHEGRMVDDRFDAATGVLAERGELLRLRRLPGGGCELTWKGPTEHGRYKVREEISSSVGDEQALRTILERLGLAATQRIERDVAEWRLDGVVVRSERYPRMDTLVEIEGDPAAIERAIARLGLDRTAFSSEPLAAFVARFERRTGLTALLAFV